MSSTSHATPPTRFNYLASFALRLLGLLAVLSGAVLLISDVLPLVAARLAHAPTSALPLLLIGTTYALAQLLLRPRRWDLVQAVLVSAAFICWGIYQLLPASPGATFLGDLVITMYVVDLSIGLRKQLQRRTSGTNQEPV